MKLTPRIGLIVAALATSLLGLGGTAAYADTGGDQTIQPMVCDDGGGGTQYRLINSGGYAGDSTTRTYGAGGGTISISRSESVSFSSSITGTVAAEAGVIFAKASVSVGITIGRTADTTLSKSYSYTVPASQTSGWVEMGFRGYRINYDKGYYASPCTWVSQRKSTIYGVTQNTFFMNDRAYSSVLKITSS